MKAKALAVLLTPMLRMSSIVHIVDPFFDPMTPHCASVIKALGPLVGVGLDEVEPTLFVHWNAERERAPDPAKVKAECNKISGQCGGMPIQSRPLMETSRHGNTLHNRYILTEIGAVDLGRSPLDDPTLGDDDVCLLSYDRYTKRWNQYCGPSPEFDGVAS